MRLRCMWSPYEVQITCITSNDLPSALLFFVPIAERPDSRSTIRYANSRLLALVGENSVGRVGELVGPRVTLALSCRFSSTFGGGIGLEDGLGNFVPVKQLFDTCRRSAVFSATGDREPLNKERAADGGLCLLSSLDCLFNSFIGSR